ncbi:RNA polymerase subunit sigma-24 [Blastococcus sp. TF02-8]|nr:RNA polymerase subunit sigma-24 [Blastococcus sp. TF02-8]
MTADGRGRRARSGRRPRAGRPACDTRDAIREVCGSCLKRCACAGHVQDVSVSPGPAAPSLGPPQSDPELQFDRLYRSAGTAVLGYALGRCASREDALDVTAETFLVAWRRRAELPNEPEEARAWLFGVARWCLANAARGDHRAQRLGQRLAEHLDVAALPDPARIHESRADTRQVRQALDALPADDRELVTLTAWEGLSPTEAGAVLGLTPGAARSRLHRARLRLRASLTSDHAELQERRRHDH